MKKITPHERPSIEIDRTKNIVKIEDGNEMTFESVNSIQNTINEPKFNIPSNIQTVNKNAYEIRRDILEMALMWVKFKSEKSSSFVGYSDDDIISTAKKFYSFVEKR